MTRQFVIAAVVSVIALSVQDAEASDWMFRRSWFSEAPAWTPDQPPMIEHPALPSSRSAYRPAIPQRGPGFAVRTQYRYNIYRLYDGQSYDTTVFRNFYVEENPSGIP